MLVCFWKYLKVLMVCFNEAKIKRLTIDRALSDDEVKHSRIRLGA
jgi:hypothetical protein